MSPDRGPEELSALVEFANNQKGLADSYEVSDYSPVAERQLEAENRRAEALALYLAGVPLREIGQQLGLPVQQTWQLVRDVEAPARDIKRMRALENQRLDAAQVAIWDRVQRGDDEAIKTFLAISRQRSKLNGLNEATKLDISMGVRNEMETAFAQLQELVMGEVVSSDDGQ